MILLNRLKIFLEQIFIHIQLLLGEDQVVMKIMTRMASWVFGIYFCYVLYEMALFSLHIHQLGFYPVEIYRSIGDKLWSRFMCQGLAANARCRIAVSVLMRWTCDYFLS